MNKVKKLSKIITLTTALTLALGITAFAANSISSNVWKESSGGQYRANGWVCILDSYGNGVDHYTTARLEGWFGTVYATSGRQYGNGTVSATTPWNGNDGSAHVYYGY